MEGVYSLANEDPEKIEAFLKMPMVEYYALIQHRVKMNEKIKKENGRAVRR